MRTTFKYLIGGHHVSEFQHSTGEKSHRYKGNQRPRGFTLVELMIVVGIIGLLAAIALPNYTRVRSTARVRTCVANLRQLDESKQQWAMELKKNVDSVPTVDDIIPYLRANSLPVCPVNGFYNLRRIELAPACSFYATGHTLNTNEDGL